MTRSPDRSAIPGFLKAAAPPALLAVLLLAGPALAQDAGGAATTAPQGESHSLIEFIKAGGVVGYLIILLSVVAVALLIDTVLRLRRDRLLPPNLVAESLRLAEEGRVGELQSINNASDSVFGRIVGGALERHHQGVEAVRQEMQQLGEAEIIRLRHRVGYIGVIATAAPMLGLLGTVIGMIGSFQVLGHSRNAARPDELAVGISTALVTTCEGLILAVPLIFAHAYIRDRVSIVAQESAHAAERILALLTATNDVRARPPVSAAQAAAPGNNHGGAAVPPLPGFPPLSGLSSVAPRS
jgi:biopolymer transport protein ExbB